MASIDEELKIKSFISEQIKSNLNIMFTANWLNNHVSALLKPYKLTPEQFNILRILKGFHPKVMCQKDILERMIARQSNVTLIIKKLKEKKLIEVERSTTDKREYVISITNSALKLLEEVNIVFTKEMPKINQLGASEAFQLNSLLDKLR